MQNKNITFVLTEECNLRCSYCYLIHKNERHRMPLNVAKAAVDYILDRRDLFSEPAVTWDFIGGEPLLEVEQIENIIGHIWRRTYELDHPWFENMKFGITTNGVLYGTPKVQRMIQRHRGSLGISITIDGPKEAHNLNRCFKDGSGSYDKVISEVPLWLSQYPDASTKMTFSHENIGFLAQSVMHLFELGIKQINANVVFENSWQVGDDKLFEEQLNQLTDLMIAKKLYKEYQCSFFNRTIGKPIDHETRDGNWCGSGRMLAIDAEGDFYPCLRFLSFALAHHPARKIGNIRDGLDVNRVRPFLALTDSTQSPEECLNCSVASGCAWCQGYNYDTSDTGTIYQRATHICLMHKARVRANKRFWNMVDTDTHPDP
ncbi:MAG: radical SAM peptide maturase, CXXX-repeat target family [Myxococcota bacterium]|nr:radical SAM peptide maturase, CXXX-repeat target family [Myxococcota bacterium]